MNVHLWDATPDQEDVRHNFQCEMTRRWKKTARDVKRAILLHDALGIGDKAPQSAMPTADKAEQFRKWMNERLSVGVGGYDGSWVEPFVRRASDRGAVIGFRDAMQANLGFMVPGAAPSAKACHDATVASLAGVCEDVSASAHDAVAEGLLLAARPHQIARAVDHAMGQGLKRSRALAEHSVTQSFTQATLDGMEARGVTHVGTVSERKRIRDFDPSEPRNALGQWSALASRALPAVRDNATGRIRTGHRGQTHANLGFDRDNPGTEERGFYDPLERKFHSGFDVPLDSSDLMTPYQKMRVLGRDGFDPDQPRNELGEWTASYSGRKGSYDKAFFTTAPNPLVSEAGETVGTKDRLVPTREAQSHLPIEDDPTLMYRGMSSGEYEAFRTAGAVQSIGSYNLSSQQGLTYFTTESRAAETYANDFTPWQYKPDFDKPAYVVVARRAAPDRLQHVEGTGAHELGVIGPVDKSDVTEVWRGRVIARDPGVANELAPSADLHWEKVASPDELKARVVPALSHRETGKLFVGKRGELHLDIATPDDPSKYRSGYYDPVEKRFVSHEELPIDTTEIMTGMQRQRWMEKHRPDLLQDAPRKTPQPKHPRSGRFAKAHIVAREMRRSKRTGQFRKQGLEAEAQRKEELAEARFGRVQGRLDVLTAGDDRVCDVCDGISEGGPYTISKARSLIPAHPNCRCVFVAAGAVKDAFDPNEPRDREGKWTETGYEFVSPSVEDIGFDQAQQGLSGRREKLMLEASGDIDRAVGIYGGATSAVIGAWADGAEHSTMTVVDHADWDKLRLAAAMKGHLADQKQVLIFKESGEGETPTASLYSFSATGDLATIHQHLLEDGAQFHTLMPTPDGAKVWIADTERSAETRATVKKAAARYGAEIDAREGRAEFLGTQRDTGSDRSQRDDARRTYEGIIERSPVQGAEAIWQGVHHRWSEPFEEWARYHALIEKQRGLEGLRATLKDPETGALYKGATHADAYRNAPPEAQARLIKYVDSRTRNFSRASIAGFTNRKGEWVTRKDAEAISGDRMYGGHAEGIAHLAERGRSELSKFHVGDYDPNEPRDPLGMWTTGGGTGQDRLGHGYSSQAKVVGGVIHTSNVYDAVRALYENRKVSLAQPREASTLIDRLGAVAKKMGQLGVHAPHFNLCNVAIRGTNLFCADAKGIPRVNMPQVKKEQMEGFRAFLQSRSTLTPGIESASYLRATQAELDGVAVAGMMNVLRGGNVPEGLKRPLFVSRDNYVLDGHHRWAAEVGLDAEDNKLGDRKMKIERVDMPITDLIAAADEFTGGKGKQAAGEHRVRSKEMIEMPPDTPAIPAGNRPTAFRPSSPDEIPEDERAWGKEVEDRVGKQFDADGYPWRHMEVLAETDASMLAGANYDTLAQYDPLTGKIQFFAATMHGADKSGELGNTVEGTASHEIMHAKTDWWMKMNSSIETKLKDKLEPGTKDYLKPLGAGFATPAQLQSDDGVTPYSTKTWQDYIGSWMHQMERTMHGGKAGKGLPFDLPFGETISEMRAVERETGQLPGSPKWQAIYRDIEKEWVHAHSKDLLGSELNPRVRPDEGARVTH